MAKQQELGFLQNRTPKLDAHNVFVQSLRPDKGKSLDQDRLVLIPFGKRHPDYQVFMSVKKYDNQADNYFLIPNRMKITSKGVRSHRDSRDIHELLVKHKEGEVAPSCLTGNLSKLSVY